MKSKKILCMIDMLGSGGAQRQLVELALGYKERGYLVAFLIYYRAFDDYYDETLNKAGIPIMSVQESNYFLRIVKMRRIMKQYNPHIVISFLEVPSFIAEMASLFPHQWKLIVGERSAAPKKMIKKRLRFFLHCHRFSDAIVANSQANLKILQKVAPEISKQKQFVIYNSLNEDNFHSDESYVFGTGMRRTILIASSHQYLKNLDGLIEAVYLLPEILRNKLCINWYGHNKFNNYDHSFEEGKQKIAQYGLEHIFSFHDATLDIYNHMRLSDAVALFSHYEGFPNAICEGMFLGKPIIATKVSDIPLLLKENENAYLCDSTSSSIAHALERFLKATPEELTEMGKCNKIKAKNLFDKEKILDQYEKLF